MNKIPTVTFRDDHINTILSGLSMEQVQKVVFDKLIPNLKLAVEKNKKECVFCYVEDYQIIIPNKSYKQVLNTLEQYYIGKEDFDTCIVLRDLYLKIK